MQQQLFGAALLTGLAIAGGVLAAADIPGNATTKAVLKLGLKYTTGLIDRPGDADWYRVRLVKGTHYAFDLQFAKPFDPLCEATVSLALAAPRGRVLYQTTRVCSEDAGFELTAARSGVYVARVTGEAREGYALRAAVDALNNTSTKAVLLVNRPANGTLLFGHDVDYFRIHLLAGKIYTLALEETGACDLPYAQLRDKQDTFILETEGFSGVVIGTDFSVTTTNDYFVKVVDGDGDYGCPYRVSVTD